MALTRPALAVLMGALCALSVVLATTPDGASADQRCGKARATNPQGKTVVFRSVARRLACLYIESFDPGAPGLPLPQRQAAGLRLLDTAPAVPRELRRGV